MHYSFWGIGVDYAAAKRAAVSSAFRFFMQVLENQLNLQKF
jgi:hypothetical protein